MIEPRAKLVTEPNPLLLRPTVGRIDERRRRAMETRSGIPYIAPIIREADTMIARLQLGQAVTMPGGKVGQGKMARPKPPPYPKPPRPPPEPPRLRPPGDTRTSKPLARITSEPFVGPRKPRPYIQQ